VLSEVADYLEELVAFEDSAALNFVNALEDLLWAFECRATASWIFQLAVKRSIYRDNVFRYLWQPLSVPNRCGYNSLILNISILCAYKIV